MENKIALGLLKDRLDQLTNMSWEERQESLALGTHIVCRSYLNMYHTLLILILLNLHTKVFCLLTLQYSIFQGFWLEMYLTGEPRKSRY